MNTLPYSFGGFSFSYDESKVIILPVPYDSTTSYLPGARFGPKEIIDASRYLEFYDIEEDVEPYKIGIYTMDEIETNKESPRLVIEDIKKIIKDIIIKKKFPVVLGGDHSISLAPVLAFHESNIPFSVIQFDAHTDLRDEYEGTKFGHASVSRRIINYAKTFQIGIRSASKKEAEFISSNSDKIFLLKAQEFNLNTLSTILDKELSNNIYITFDVDVFDPSIIPSVGTPEPGGLNFTQILQALRLIVEKKNVIGFDIVELAPIPYLAHPNFTIAKLIYKLIGLIYKKGVFDNGRYYTK